VNLAPAMGLFQLTVIDSQKICLTCERRLLQVPTLGPGRSLNDRGFVRQSGSCDGRRLVRRPRWSVPTYHRGNFYVRFAGKRHPPSGGFS
jgi:hypothetical protein